jgi:acyl carrier protein
MSETETALTAFIAELGGGAPVLPETPIMEQGLLDSMGLVRLIQFVEERFGIGIADADVTPELFESPRRLAAYIDARRR